MPSILGYYQQPDELLKCCVALDLETLHRSVPSPLEQTNLPPVPDEYYGEEYGDEPPLDNEELGHPRIKDRRIAVYSAVIMQDARNADKVKISFGSLPSLRHPEPLSEAEMLYGFAYSMLGLCADEKALLEQGMRLEKLGKAIETSGFPEGCTMPVFVGAFVDGDLQTLFDGFHRHGMTSEFVRYPHPDQRERARSQYSYNGQFSGMKVDLLALASGGSFVRDKISLADLAERHGLPGKYYPYDRCTVLDLWREGKMEALIEYCRVDALNHHFLNLYYMYFDGSLTRPAFTALWEKSAQKLQSISEQKEERNVGLKWFLKKLKTASEMKVIRLNPRKEGD